MYVLSDCPYIYVGPIIDPRYAGFENIKVALRILATLPVTSCECERSFYALRRLKDYARSTMVSERLNGLALMYIHQEIVPVKLLKNFLLVIAD